MPSSGGCTKETTEGHKNWTPEVAILASMVATPQVQELNQVVAHRPSKFWPWPLEAKFESKTLEGSRACTK